MPFAPERRASNKLCLGVATAALTGLLAWGASAIWAGKLGVEVFQAHVAQHALDRQLDSVWHAQQGAKLDEVVCLLKPKHHSC